MSDADPQRARLVQEEPGRGNMFYGTLGLVSGEGIPPAGSCDRGQLENNSAQLETNPIRNEPNWKRAQLERSHVYAASAYFVRHAEKTTKENKQYKTTILSGMQAAGGRQAVMQAAGQPVRMSNTNHTIIVIFMLIVYRSVIYYIVFYYTSITSFFNRRQPGRPVADRGEEVRRWRGTPFSLALKPVDLNG